MGLTSNDGPSKRLPCFQSENASSAMRPSNASRNRCWPESRLPICAYPSVGSPYKRYVKLLCSGLIFRVKGAGTVEPLSHHL